MCALAARVSTHRGCLVAAPAAQEPPGEGLPALLLVASNPSHDMVCFVCLQRLFSVRKLVFFLTNSGSEEGEI